MKIPLRTLQYIEVLKLTSRLAKLDLLNGHGKKALDVGCGSGYGLLALTFLGYDAYGFDINKEKVLKAKRMGFKNVVRYDAQVGILFNNHFHLITCFGVLEHLFHPEKALMNMLLKSPNIVVIDVPNRHTEFLRLIYLTILKHERLRLVYCKETASY